jgi:hypothetical protein
MAFDDVSEALGAGVDVATGGVEGGVAEQGLELDDVGAGLQGVGGEAVAQGVDHAPGGDAGPDAGSGVEPLDQVRDLGAASRRPWVSPSRWVAGWSRSWSEKRAGLLAA